MEYKWRAFASRLIWVQLAVYLTWLLAFTGFTWVFQVGFTLPEAPPALIGSLSPHGLSLLIGSFAFDPNFTSCIGPFCWDYLVMGSTWAYRGIREFGHSI